MYKKVFLFIYAMCFLVSTSHNTFVFSTSFTHEKSLCGVNIIRHIKRQSAFSHKPRHRIKVDSGFLFAVLPVDYNWHTELTQTGY